jgi:Tfp pilus assembly protein PilO
LWFLLINSQRQILAHVRQEAQKVRDQLARGEAALKTADEVKTQWEEVTRRLQQREAVMAPPMDSYSWLIQTLNDLRSSHRVEIPQFGQPLASEVGMFSKFPYRAALCNVRGTANYHDFGKFLADLENKFPFVRVQNVDLSAAAESQAGGREKLNFTMELLTLVKPNAL